MHVKRTRNSTQKAPSDIRLSEHFLLSDFMGCDSVYRHGYKNVFIDPDGAKIAEAKHLCETILEPILADYGPISVTYGYISPDLSRKIVTYQSPDKPSYHRWDKGAAADAIVHGWVKDSAPIYLAHEIDQKYPYSRMITYSESEGICLATQLGEEPPRCAFYENRYTGEKGGKPLYIRKAASKSARLREVEGLVLPCDWRGAGYPTYHGGGRRQLHHVRCGEFSVMSDFLYTDESVAIGVKNLPRQSHFPMFERAAAFYAEMLYILDTPRLSITRGFSSSGRSLFSWDFGFALEFKPPEYLSVDQLMDAAFSTGMVKSVGGSNGRCIVAEHSDVLPE